MKVDETFQDSMKSEEQRERMLMTLSIVPLFAKFQREEIGEVLALAKRVRYDPMEVLFQQGSVDRTLHLVLSGSVLLYRTDERGNETIVGQRGIDSCFGEIAFITGGERNTSAKAGPGGCETVIVEPGAFEELAAARSYLMFKVLTTIIDNIGERLHDLPANFRNYVIWGMKRPGVQEGAEALDWSYLAIGFAVGGAAGVIAGTELARFSAEAYPVMSLVPYTERFSTGAMTLLLGAVGLFIGWWLALSKMRRLRGGVGPHACMNCAHVVWEGADEKFGCAYKVLQLKGKIVKPGTDYDTPTDCPTFQYREIARLG